MKWKVSDNEYLDSVVIEALLKLIARHVLKHGTHPRNWVPYRYGKVRYDLLEGGDTATITAPGLAITFRPHSRGDDRITFEEGGAAELKALAQIAYDHDTEWPDAAPWPGVRIKK